MFEKAAQNYFKWNCSVGGGTPAIKGRLYGQGCVLDDHHTLTAYHCWSSISTKYKWPVVFRSDGLFRCEVVFKSTDADIAILRSVQLLEPDNDKYKIYPEFSESRLLLGTSVGFMSHLDLLMPNGETNSYTHFASGCISMFLFHEETEIIKFVVSSTVIQRGFSGSAVFRPDGQIVGVVIRMLSFLSDPFDTASQRYVLPVVTPILPLINDINTILMKT